jgi:hypothetical protein
VRWLDRHEYNHWGKAEAEVLAARKEAAWRAEELAAQDKCTVAKFFATVPWTSANRAWWKLTELAFGGELGPGVKIGPAQAMDQALMVVYVRDFRDTAEAPQKKCRAPFRRGPALVFLSRPQH